MLGAHDQARMVVLLQPHHDLRGVEFGGVRLGCLGETKHAAGVALEGLGERVDLAAKIGSFQSRPLAPEVYAGCHLDQIGDEGSADPRGNLEE